MVDFTAEVRKIENKPNIFNGLIKALGNLLQSGERVSERLDAHDLPPHLQRDIGVDLESRSSIR
ncbi:hypothetical protein GCM10007094_39520 [Pseudovibrio japonicus]|uniref:Uncharacterized protein n=1 Tax=Pseudovibrio japonicus TaxID=366534 RepID=A0ABQ3EMB8_9HYPH|nr:hypothetical protein [Pseudovibrio japonicus]GHB46304.1 hypothetical protein GCM10007094_39520 [Pseudovibrio japonicus]